MDYLRAVVDQLLWISCYGSVVIHQLLNQLCWISGGGIMTDGDGSIMILPISMPVTRLHIALLLCCIIIISSTSFHVKTLYANLRSLDYNTRKNVL